eukprot:351557-Chlamydomonas_euryale.AAC.26
MQQWLALFAPLPQLQKNLEFADEIIKASRSYRGQGNFPDRPMAVTKHEMDYWREVAAGTGNEPPDFDEHQPARVWDYTECMEFFYNGVPWELKAREYAAATLKAAAVELERTSINARQSEALSKSATPTSVVAVSAMEAVGVSEQDLQLFLTCFKHAAIPSGRQKKAGYSRAAGVALSLGRVDSRMVVALSTNLVSPPSSLFDPLLSALSIGMPFVGPLPVTLTLHQTA